MQFISINGTEYPVKFGLGSLRKLMSKYKLKKLMDTDKIMDFISIDGGAFASATGSASEVGNGVYSFDASAADMNGDIIIFKFTATGADPFITTISTTE